MEITNSFCGKKVEEAEEEEEEEDTRASSRCKPSISHQIEGFRMFLDLFYPNMWQVSTILLISKQFEENKDLQIEDIIVLVRNGSCEKGDVMTLYDIIRQILHYAFDNKHRTEMLPLIEPTFLEKWGMCYTANNQITISHKYFKLGTM